MSKGLGSVQRKVIAALKYCKKENSSEKVFRARDNELAKKEPSAEITPCVFMGRSYVDVFLSQKDGWFDVGSLVWMVVHGNLCFETVDSNFDTPTVAQKQSVWRAIRGLKKKGMVSTQRILPTIQERILTRGLTNERIIKLC